jgi:hypothetical protein
MTMASDTITVEVSIAGWRYALARAAVRLACVLARVAPETAVRIGEAAARFATRRLRIRAL